MIFSPQKAAVIGAGTMGAQIAAHLANAGIPVLLLDIAPTALTTDEAAKGLTLASPAVRNRIVRTLFERMKKLSPAPLFTPETAQLITIGNIDDNFGDLATVDWIIEAVLERMELKQTHHARLAGVVGPDTVVTTNTSGLPIARILEGLPASYRKRFFAAHFFNPPRYMRLLELVPTVDTDANLLRAFSNFAEATLGKGVVIAKDTPCFIGNRIGCFDIQTVLWLATTEGLGVDEIDALTGSLIGRPASATFRLCDLVGIDLIDQLGRNLKELLPDSAEQSIFQAPPFLNELIARGWWGEKKGQGFYQRVQTAHGREIQTLHLVNLEYRAQQKAAFPALATIGKIPDLAARLRALVASDDPAGRFAWKHLSAVLCYAAAHVPEISNEVLAVDQAMRWGYHWELGPFQIWDALGVANVAHRLEKEGRPVPPLVSQLLAAGHTQFYETHSADMVQYAPISRTYAPVPKKSTTVELAKLHPVIQNDAARLIDLGDGVACFAFQSKLNVIGEATLSLFRESLEIVQRDFGGLVIGNQGAHFSAGANLKEFAAHIDAGRWTELEHLLRTFQTLTGTLRQFAKPVVAAVHGYTFGGGCEFALGCDHVVAFAETTMGLPEFGVGLIPGAHGTKEMLLRCTENISRSGDPDYFAAVKQAWETIALVKISTSAPDAAKLHFLRPGEWTLAMNREHALSAAKARVQQLSPNYRPRAARNDIPAIGQSGKTTLQTSLHAMRSAGHISAHDQHIGSKLAHVLCGGDLSSLHFVSESYVLDLEREAFLSLCGEPKTVERIQHMLKTGKPLRN